MLKFVKKGHVIVAAACLSVAAVSLAMWGCGTSGYGTPPGKEQILTKTDTALITAAQLKTWVDAGLVNKAAGYERVVILDISENPFVAGSTTVRDVDSANAYYTTGHIPGAQLISGGSNAFQDHTRAEGPLSITGAMVATGAVMDKIIQDAGIDENTTIVFTTNTTAALNLTRPYTTFRYWGFPKNRLKVLQGGNAAWNTAGYSLTSQVSTVTKSTYGVAQNGKTNINTDMRVSLPEMITYVKAIVAGNTDNVTILDTVRYTTGTQISSTTDLLDTTKYTPFDGAVKGSYSFPLGGGVSGLTFKTANEIKTAISAATASNNTPFGDASRDATKTFITMCRAGNNASQAYFLLDGIAYYNSSVDVKWYDGSLGQWNLMASSDHTARNTTGATVNAGGKLKVGSIWDTTSLMDNLTWNVSRTISATNLTQRPIIDYTSRVYGVEPTFAEGNQIETADKAYRSAVTGTSGGSASSSGGGC